VDFFSYQLAVAVIELTGLVAMTYRLVHLGSTPREKFSWKPLKGNLAFSISIAFVTTVWVLMTQADKLILSKTLSLSNYGIFSLAIVASGVVYTLGAPINQALLPRLTKLVAQGDSKRVEELYAHSTQAVCVLASPAIAILAFFAEPILRAWTGKPDIAHGAAPILILYALGNGCILLSNFAYYIQYSKGDLFLQFLGQALMVVVLLPLLIWSAEHFGGVGTGAVWASVNGIYALIWIPIVHARVLKGAHWRWMFHDVIPIVVPTFLAAWFLSYWIRWPDGRISTFVTAGLVGLALIGISASGSTAVRHKLGPTLKKMVAGLNP
jgi:O-antigen/teichoic acid export membrane protein